MSTFVQEQCTFYSFITVNVILTTNLYNMEVGIFSGLFICFLQITHYFSDTQLFQVAFSKIILFKAVNEYHGR